MDKIVITVISDKPYQNKIDAERSFRSAVGPAFNNMILQEPQFEVLCSTAPVWHQSQNRFTKTYFLKSATSFADFYQLMFNTHNVFSNARKFGWHFSSEAKVYTNITTKRDQLLDNLKKFRKLDGIRLESGFSSITDLLDETLAVASDPYGLYHRYFDSFLYFTNEPKIYALTNLQCAIYNHLYLSFSSDLVQLAKLDYYEENVSNPFMSYAEFIPPNNEMGMPFLEEILDPNVIVDDTYFKEFVSQVSDIIEAYKTHEYTPRMPMYPITIDQRLKNSGGHYFILPARQIDENVPDFIEMQLSYLDRLLSNLTIFEFNKESIMAFARTKWTV